MNISTVQCKSNLHLFEMNETKLHKKTLQECPGKKLTAPTGYLGEGSLHTGGQILQ